MSERTTLLQARLLRLAVSARAYIEALGETDDDTEMNAFNDLVDATDEAEEALCA